jgi:tetratricopeptide (TPR) repeat protein
MNSQLSNSQGSKTSSIRQRLKWNPLLSLLSEYLATILLMIRNSATRTSNSMKKLCLTPTVLVLAMLMIHGCANQPVNSVAHEETTTPAVEPEAEIVKANTPEAEQEYPVRPFSTEGLYELLVGELAGIRNNLPLSLEKYLSQARQTRDPGVVSRAARIAAYLDNRAVLLEMSLLWTEVDPEALDAHSMASLSLSRDGQHISALPHAEFALQQGNSEPLMALVISANQATIQQRDVLLQQYPRLETLMPENKTLLLTKAMLLRQQDRLPDALNTVEQLLQKAPSEEPAIMLKAQLLHQAGKKEEAASFLEHSLLNIPNSKRLRLQYARFLAEDDLEGAHQQLTLLVEEYPNDPELIYTLALASRGLGLRVMAQQLLIKLTRYPSTASSAHFELGTMAEQDNHIESVLMHYRQVHSGSKFLPAAVRLSKFMINHGQLKNARLYLQQLRLKNPRLAASLYQIESELLAEQALIDDAYLLLSEAILHTPNDIQLLYMRSLLSEKKNDYANSEQDLRAILAQDSDNAMALNALGYTLTVHTDRYKEAHELILRALELNPGDPATIDSLGWVLYRLGKHDDAIHQLRRAIEKLPDPEVASHLGEVLWVTGQHEEATSVWQIILENDPDNDTIRQTMKRLQAE